MSKLFRRFRGAFTRTPRPQPSPPTTNPYSRRVAERNRKLANEIDDIDNYEENVPNDRPSQQTEDRRQVRPLDDDHSSTSSNAGNTQRRNVSNSIQSNLPNNNRNINSILNNNTVPISDPSARAGIPIQSQNNDPPSRLPLNPVKQPSLDESPSVISPNQPSNPTINHIPHTPVKRNLPLLMNRPRRPLQISPNSTLIGFPTTQTQQSHIPPSWPTRSSFPQHLKPSLSAFRPRNSYATFEYDYPIRNVVIDGNIPSSMAMKINNAVEQDRLHTTRQLRHNPQTQRTVSLLTGNSHQNGLRHIREIPQSTNPSFQLLITETPQLYCSYQYDLNYFPTPVHHFIACASRNDPMRNY